AALQAMLSVLRDCLDRKENRRKACPRLAGAARLQYRRRPSLPAVHYQRAALRSTHSQACRTTEREIHQWQAGMRSQAKDSRRHNLKLIKTHDELSSSRERLHVNCPLHFACLRIVSQGKRASTRDERQRLYTAVRSREKPGYVGGVSAEDAQLDVVPVHVFRALRDFQVRQYRMILDEQHNRNRS